MMSWTLANDNGLPLALARLQSSLAGREALRAACAAPTAESSQVIHARAPCRLESVARTSASLSECLQRLDGRSVEPGTGSEP